MNVYIGGEDSVTRSIAKRLSIYCHEDVVPIDIALSDWGAKSLKKLPSFVELGHQSPTVCVYDTDGDCVLDILRKICPTGWKSNFSTINFAIDEAESWVLADREGFSEHFQVDINLIPVIPCSGSEISNNLPYKTSLFMLREIFPYSRIDAIQSEMVYVYPNKKPSTYNEHLTPFINSVWNIDNAMLNSESLRRAAQRVQAMIGRYKEGTL